MACEILAGYLGREEEACEEATLLAYLDAFIEVMRVWVDGYGGGGNGGRRREENSDVTGALYVLTDYFLENRSNRI